MSTATPGWARATSWSSPAPSGCCPRGARPPRPSATSATCRTDAAGATGAAPGPGPVGLERRSGRAGPVPGAPVEEVAVEQEGGARRPGQPDLAAGEVELAGPALEIGAA